MKKLLLILILCLLQLSAAGDRAWSPFQLIAITTDWCPVCKQFKKEVLPRYKADLTSTNIPLIEIDITKGKSLPLWYKEAYRKSAIKRLFGVPTFVIWDSDDKRELVRWVGYISEENFYDMLDNALRLAPINKERCEVHNVCKPWFVSKKLNQPALISP